MRQCSKDMADDGGDHIWQHHVAKSHESDHHMVIVAAGKILNKSAVVNPARCYATRTRRSSINIPFAVY